MPRWTTASTPATRPSQARLRPGLSGLSGPAGAARPGACRSTTTIDPGQTVEGTFVSSFRLTKQQWDARKNLNFTFAFRYQPSLMLAPHAAVTDQ